MARDPKIVGSEQGAWEKLQAGLRMSIEAATEISVRRDDNRWATISRLLEKMLDNASKLYLAARAGATRGIGSERRR
jgi:hypothetical protein